MEKPLPTCRNMALRPMREPSYRDKSHNYFSITD
jgi:hypothetical protein